MSEFVGIDVALKLLGLGGQSWAVWRAAAHGETLASDELKAFAGVSGGRAPPTRKVRELVCVVSRRAGKGRIAAALAVHASAMTDHSSALAPGERGVVACISPTKEQAAIVKSYVLGYLEASPALKGEIGDVTADEVRLKNGNVITTLASDFRTLRGRTLITAILDEASFLRDEVSAAPDVETARALRPGLATTHGMLIVISSPYRRSGLVFELHRDHFGRDDDDVLVVQGSSQTFNPTIDQQVIDVAAINDPAAVGSEWLGEWRSNLSTFLSEEMIEAAVDRDRPAELPPQDRFAYHAAADSSGGRHDAFTFAIVHREGERMVADVVRGHRPPFDPMAVAAEFALLAQEYRCPVVWNDNYAPAWVEGAFTKGGMSYRRLPLKRSDLYLEGLPWFVRGLLSIHGDPILLRELRTLERAASRTGRDIIDHPKNGSDDHANALFAAMWAASQSAEVKFPTVGWGQTWEIVHGPRVGFGPGSAYENGRAEHRAYLASRGQGRKDEFAA